MIALCSILEVKRVAQQIVGINVQLIKIIAACQFGPTSRLQTEPVTLSAECAAMLANLPKYNITGYIPKPYVIR